MADVRAIARKLIDLAKGVIRNVTAQPDGLYADFHFNPKHALAEQLAWDAEHSPANVGFSHDVQAKTVRRDGKVVVEEISRVESVDLVADPATTDGLFESEHTVPAGIKPATPNGGGVPERLDEFLDRLRGNSRPGAMAEFLNEIHGRPRPGAFHEQLARIREQS